MELGNPLLSGRAFDRARSDSSTMTIGGTVFKTVLLLAILAATFMWTWITFPPVIGTEGKLAMQSGLAPWLWGSLIGGFALAMIVVFNPQTSPILAPLYAACEGIVLGGISSWFDASYTGIAVQAALITMAVLCAMLALYSFRVLRATPAFTKGVVVCTAGITLVYLAQLILSFWNITIPFIHENGWQGILFSLFVVAVAALNLIIDFDNVESGVRGGAPKSMEWFAAFGLVVTLVWLYLEILKLLAKAKSND